MSASGACSGGAFAINVAGAPEGLRVIGVTATRNGLETARSPGALVLIDRTPPAAPTLLLSAAARALALHPQRQRPRRTPMSRCSMVRWRFVPRARRQRPLELHRRPRPPEHVDRDRHRRRRQRQRGVGADPDRPESAGDAVPRGLHRQRSFEQRRHHHGRSDPHRRHLSMATWSRSMTPMRIWAPRAACSSGTFSIDHRGHRRGPSRDQCQRDTQWRGDRAQRRRIRADRPHAAGGTDTGAACAVRRPEFRGQRPRRGGRGSRRGAGAGTFCSTLADGNGQWSCAGDLAARPR